MSTLRVIGLTVCAVANASAAVKSYKIAKEASTLHKSSMEVIKTTTDEHALAQARKNAKVESGFKNVCSVLGVANVVVGVGCAIAAVHEFME